MVYVVTVSFEIESDNELDAKRDFITKIVEDDWEYDDINVAVKVESTYAEQYKSACSWYEDECKKRDCETCPFYLDGDN